MSIKDRETIKSRRSLLFIIVNKLIYIGGGLKHKVFGSYRGKIVNFVED